MMRPPVRPIRVEPLLLANLREAFPTVTFSTMVPRSDDPPYRECVLVAEPQQLASVISQYVRLRLSVTVTRDDGTGDWQQSQELAADIERHILSTDYPHVVSSEHSSGPMRIVDGDVIIAYSIILLTVTVG